MPFVTLDGRRLHYWAHLDDPEWARPALVLLHGVGGSLFNWPPQLRRLPGHNVYALDLPGHGRSQGEGWAAMEAFAHLALAWAQALQLPPFVLAGHSLGGAIALSVALQEPDRLRGLVLVAAAAHLPVNPRILEGIRSDPAAVGGKLVEWMHGPQATPAQKRQYLRHLLAVDAGVLHNYWMACNGFDLRQNLAQIATPTLIVAASQDRMTPVEESQYLAEHLPDADLTVLPGGHMVLIEQATLVTSSIMGFLARLRLEDAG